MRTFTFLLLLSVMLWSCTNKQGDVKPGDDGIKDNGNNGSTSTPTDPNKLTRDDSIHMVVFTIYAQKVKTSVTGKTLKLEFNENVNLFLTSEAYKQTSAIHLLQDFKKASLAAFDFTTVNQDGQTTYNSIDDNLNNVKAKTIKDTIINGVSIVKINVNRLLTFSKTYNTNQLATDQQTLILNKTSEIVTFSSYAYYNQKNYPTTSAVAYLQYVK